MRNVTSDVEMLQVIEAAQRYESWAFDELYTLYANKLYRFILFRVSNEALAEDLVAEVFVRVLNRIRSFRGRTEAAFSAWLYRIARNLITDHYRKHGKIQSTSLEKARNLADDRPDPFQHTATRQTHEELYQVIGQLTPEQQQVILFRFFEGMGNAQIARILGKTEGAVKALQHRALATLKRLFDTL